MKPRREPGQIFFPAQYTHVFQKYWHCLNDPLSHQDCSESDFTKAAMHEFASALSTMDLSSFEPQVDAEASDKSCRIASDAAISRLCPIQDAIDYWNPGMGHVEAVTGQGGSALDQGGHNLTPD
jgi:hypothetical protein